MAEDLRILRPPGEFNHARVVATEYSVEHWLNGIHLMTFDMTSGQWAEMVGGKNLERALRAREPISRLPLARLALRGGGSDVWLRNIKIRRLQDEQPLGASGAPNPLTPGESPAAERWVWVPTTEGAESPFSVSANGVACGVGVVG